MYRLHRTGSIKNKRRTYHMTEPKSGEEVDKARSGEAEMMRKPT
jgi:hypothetical protein